jgi:Protein of unknown function (DUF3667)
MDKTAICKNCNQKFEGKFCNNCGQTADTHRLSLHYIWHDLQHGLFHFDNGIFFTIKQLLTRPGHSIREFVNGKRVRHFKPLSFVVILATFYGLLSHYFITISFDSVPIHERKDIIGAYEAVSRWSLSHLAYSTLILILSTTVASWLVFKKQGYNLVEHLVLNTFYRGLTLVIALLLFPVLYFLQKGGGASLQAYGLIFQFLDIIVMYWCYCQFFNKLTKLKSLGLTLLTYLFMAMINMVIGYFAGIIVKSVA